MRKVPNKFGNTQIEISCQFELALFFGRDCYVYNHTLFY